MDPSGDVILTLTRPNEPLAVLQTGPPLVAKETASSVPSGNDIEQASSDADKRKEIPTGTDEKEDASEPKPVTFRVSSRHLILASPMFKAALTGGVWKEGNPCDDKHEFRISAEGWDTEAMVIVLRAIHGRYRQVPTTVELEMLAKIAVIVDYYALHEAMHLLGQTLINGLKKALPRTTCPKRTIALWICVSWVFSATDVFMHVTQVAIQHGLEQISGLGLPVPPAVIDRVNKRRRSLIDMVSIGIHDIKQSLIEGRGGCNTPCGAMQLGALIQGMYALKLLHHSPGTDSQGFKLSELLKGVEAIKCPGWCECTYTFHRAHQCPTPSGRAVPNASEGAKVVSILSLERRIQFLVSRTKDKMGGLQLADFVSSSSEEK